MEFTMSVIAYFTTETFFFGHQNMIIYMCLSLQLTSTLCMAHFFLLSSEPWFFTEGLASELSLVSSCGIPIVGYLGNIGHLILGRS